jgi:hypothetical protein
LTRSAVRAPISRSYAQRANSTIAASIALPAVAIVCEATIPPSAITATSVVPLPMSTIIEPSGSLIGSPAPMAAAIGYNTT